MNNYIHVSGEWPITFIATLLAVSNLHSWIYLSVCNIQGVLKCYSSSDNFGLMSQVSLACVDVNYDARDERINWSGDILNHGDDTSFLNEDFLNGASASPSTNQASLSTFAAPSASPVLRQSPRPMLLPAQHPALHPVQPLPLLLMILWRLPQVLLWVFLQVPRKVVCQASLITFSDAKLTSDAHVTVFGEVTKSVLLSSFFQHQTYMPACDWMDGQCQVTTKRSNKDLKKWNNLLAGFS